MPVAPPAQPLESRSPVTDHPRLCAAAPRGGAWSTSQKGRSVNPAPVYASYPPRSKAFYEKALAPLGISVIMEFGQAAGLGRGQKPDFWISAGVASYHKPEHLTLITPTHVAFAAKTHADVDAFYAAALAAGGKDFGAPGPRPEYHPNYYGGFVLDPDGHNIEAVCHGS